MMNLVHALLEPLVARSGLGGRLQAVVYMVVLMGWVLGGYIKGGNYGGGAVW